MSRAVVFFLPLVSACGLFPKSHKEQATTSAVQTINERADAYCSLEDAEASPAGFVGHDCDLVLFNGLRAAGCPASKIDLAAAEDPTKPGQWNRDDTRTCYEQGRTDARFSRDMLVGLLTWVWYSGKPALPVLDRLIAYGELHGWTICEAHDAVTQASKCNVGSGLKATVYEMRFRLGGADSTLRSGAQFWDPTASGFTAHLQVLHLYLRGLMFGAVSDPELAYFELMAQNAPANALFEAVARKFKTSDLGPPTDAVLGDTARFPLETLPTSAGRCTDYLWQRVGPDSDDWRPCPPDSPAATYSGIDLAFFRAVVTDRFPVGQGLELSLDGDGKPRRNPYHWAN